MVVFLKVMFWSTAAVLGPWYVWNHYIAGYINVPQLGIFPALGIALSLRAPSILARGINWLPRFVQGINKTMKESGERDEIRSQVRQALAAGDTVLVARILDRLRKELYEIHSLRVKQAIDEEIAQIVA